VRACTQNKKDLKDLKDQLTRRNLYGDSGGYEWRSLHPSRSHTRLGAAKTITHGSGHTTVHAHCTHTHTHTHARIPTPLKHIFYVYCCRADTDLDLGEGSGGGFGCGFQLSRNSQNHKRAARFDETKLEVWDLGLGEAPNWERSGFLEIATDHGQSTLAARLLPWVCGNEQRLDQRSRITQGLTKTRSKKVRTANDMVRLIQQGSTFIAIISLYWCDGPFSLEGGSSVICMQAQQVLCRKSKKVPIIRWQHTIRCFSTIRHIIHTLLRVAECYKRLQLRLVKGMDLVSPITTAPIPYGWTGKLQTLMCLGTPPIDYG